MLISDLKNGIVTGNINNFHIFTGEEEGIMDIYINQIAKKKNLTIKWADSMQEVCKLANLKSLVTVKYLYLVRQDNAILNQENLWLLMRNFVGNYVVLIQPQINKKNKFYKEFEDLTVKFDKLSTEQLSQYGKKFCPGLSLDKIEKLCGWCGNSYLRLLNELDKVSTLAKTMKISNDSSFDMLDADKGIFKEREFDVFNYVNKILTRNSYACYYDKDYVKSQQCEILLVSLLTASFRNLVLLKNDGGGKGVCERTGLTGWQIKCAIEVDEYFNIDECEKLLLFLQETEVKIKTGVLSPEITLDYILAEIL